MGGHIKLSTLQMGGVKACNEDCWQQPEQKKKKVLTNTNLK